MATIPGFLAAIKTALRDYVTADVPASGAHNPPKNDLRSAADQLGAILTDLTNATVQGDKITKGSWAALQAAPGTRAGQAGEVFGAGASTHTDPITLATVPDNGLYSWTLGAPNGWKWIGDNTVTAKADKATQVTGAGLATGGGDLSASRAITVPKASKADVAAATDDAKAVTPLALADQVALIATNAQGLQSARADLAAEIATRIEVAGQFLSSPGYFEIYEDQDHNVLTGVEDGSRGRVVGTFAANGFYTPGRADVGGDIAAGGRVSSIDAFRAPMQVSPDVPQGWSEIWVDEADHIFGGVTKDGTTWGTVDGVAQPGGGGLSAFDAAELATEHGYEADCTVPAPELDVLDWWLFWGQSTDIGGNLDGNPANQGGGYLYTTTALHPGKVLMLSSGIRPLAANTGLVDARETLVSPTYGETGRVAFLNRLSDLINDAVGFRHPVGGSISGNGGTAYIGLMPGTPAMQRLVNQAAEVVVFARDMGFKRVRFCGLITRQGNTDSGITSRRQRVRNLNQLQEYCEATFRAISGQPEPFIVYVAQHEPSTAIAGIDYDANGIAQAALDAAAMNPKIRVVPPGYDMPRDAAKTVHHSSKAYAWAGEREARVVFEDFYCAGREPFAPSEEAWFTNAAGTAFRIKVNCYHRPLRFRDDGSLVKVEGLEFGAPVNQRGFHFTDGASSPPYVANVTLSNGSDPQEGFIDLALSGASTGPRPRIFYAMRETANEGDARHGARGLISNSLEDVSSIDARPLPEFLSRFFLNVRR